MVHHFLFFSEHMWGYFLHFMIQLVYNFLHFLTFCVKFHQLYNTLSRLFSLFHNIFSLFHNILPVLFSLFSTLRLFYDAFLYHFLSFITRLVHHFQCFMTYLIHHFLSFMIQSEHISSASWCNPFGTICVYCMTHLVPFYIFCSFLQLFNTFSAWFSLL